MTSELLDVVLGRSGTRRTRFIPLMQMGFAKRVLPTFCISALLAAPTCVQRLTRSSAPPEKVESWPRQLADRTLQHVTDSYAIYAAEGSNTRTLDTWIQDQISRFDKKYGPHEKKGRGLVIVIESADEPLPEIEEWRNRHVKRGRQIWSGDGKRNQRFSAPSARGYSFFGKPYFRESFVIPYQDALKIGLLNRTMPRPAWICFLTRDEYALAAFDQRMRALKQNHDEKSAKLKKNWSPDHRLFKALQGLSLELLTPNYRSIDLDLMRLQRQETLYIALLNASEIEEESRAEKIRMLQAKVDEEWEQLWAKRPKGF